MRVRIFIDGQQFGTSTTDYSGAYYYVGAGPTSRGLHTVKVIFDGNSVYAPSSANANYCG